MALKTDNYKYSSSGAYKSIKPVTSAKNETANVQENKPEKLLKETKILITLAATAAIAGGIYLLTRGKSKGEKVQNNIPAPKKTKPLLSEPPSQNPAQTNKAPSSLFPEMSPKPPIPDSETINPKSVQAVQTVKTTVQEQIMTPLMLKRPEIKFAIEFPKGYREKLSSFEKDIVDYAADEFARTRQQYFLNDLFRNEKPLSCPLYNIYYEILQAKYDNLRLANYDKFLCGDTNIEKITQKTTKNTNVLHYGGWHYRTSNSYINMMKNPGVPQEAVDRFSLNVKADENLIKSLDEYFETGKANGCYKTPDDFAGWTERHDPITLYFYEPITDKIKNDIIEIVKPYIRSQENVLAGEIIIPGIAKQKSPTRESIQKLVDEAKQLDIKLAKGILKSFDGDVRHLEVGNAKASAGQFSVAEDLVNFVKSLKERYSSAG